MDLRDLIAKMTEIDQPLKETDKGDMDKDGTNEPDSKEWKQNRDSAIKKAKGEDKPVEENIMDEYGSLPMDPMKQTDNVSMNLNMNASGSGGIRDLLNVLKDIQDGPDDSVNGKPVTSVDIDDMGSLIDDDFANVPDETYSDMSAVVNTGNDLHSKGVEAPNQAGGGNPWNIKPRLESLYNEIKLREGSGLKKINSK